jgi:hypothetical protein
MVESSDMPSQEVAIAEESSILGQQLSVMSLQALLNEVEDNRDAAVSANASVTSDTRRTLSRSHHSASQLQRLIDDTATPDSPSLIPLSGVYSMTPVSSIRTAVLSASFRELLDETEKDQSIRIPRPPLFRRASSKVNVLDCQENTLDTAERSGESPLESSRRELVEALDDVLDFL